MPNISSYPTLKEVYIAEISRQESENYYKDIKLRNPTLHQELTALAQLILRFDRSGKSPSKIVDTFKIYLNKYKDTNPLHSGDTLGVKMFIDNLAKDRDEARSAKHYYDNVFNATLRKRYKKGTDS